jgi:hypothetical protein
MPLEKKSLRVLIQESLLVVGAVAGCLNDIVADEYGPRYGSPQGVVYEFGLNISSQGESDQIVATVPVPIEWPEQKIFLVSENKTDNLKKFSYKDLGNDGRQLILKANRLGAGESARGTIILRIEKRDILPPGDPQNLSFAKQFTNGVGKYLKPSPYIESNHPTIRKIAESIPIDQHDSAWQQVETIYRWVRDNIAYQFDEEIHSCLDALGKKRGDCEELSSVFIALCRARGIPARAVWVPSHTYPEFYLVDQNATGHWFPCQAAGDYQFGAMSEPRPILQKGDKFRVSGHLKELRYIQPTLTAKNATSGLTIEFIAMEHTNSVPPAGKSDSGK